MKKLIAIIFLFQILNTYSQTGSLKGIVIDSKTKETIVGANVYIENTSIGATTDFEGKYEIKNLKEGNYNIKISFISYKSQIFEKIRIEANKETELNISLEDEITTLKGIVVSTKRKQNTDVAVLNNIKQSDAVVSGVSSQQISKTTDKDASEVVRRIPGVTIIDERFIIVRGLSERYNSVLLNSVGTPSSEADVKAFSFDVIPSGVIDRILVYKTPSPEIPSDFVGANIQIFTKNTIENDILNISYTAGFKFNTSFRDFQKYKGSSTDFLGFDNGQRNLPSIMPSINEFAEIINNPTPQNKELRAEYGKAFSKTWESESSTAPFDNSLSIVFAKNFNIKKINISNITNFSYSNSYKFSESQINSYLSYDTIYDKSILSYSFNDKIYSNSVSLNGLMNWNFNINPNNTIEFKNLINQQGVSKTTLREGFENYREQFIKATELSYNEKTLFTSQLLGSHKLFEDKTNINWSLGYSLTNRNQPDTRRLTKTLSFDQDPSSEYYNQYGLYFPNRADPELAGRLFSDMKENLFVLNLSVNQKINILQDFKPSVILGTYIENKNRDFNSRLFGFIRNSSTPWNYGYQSTEIVFADSNINNLKGIKIDEATSPTDSYDANTALKAGYFLLKFEIIDRFKISTGIRFEKYNFALSSRNANNNEYINESDTLNLFPSVNVSYQINEKSLIRIAYGKTINRPEFREIAPYNYYNFEMKAGIYGNPELKNSYIQNVDLRYEIYPSQNEMINVGLFYKKFSNPIEAIEISAGSGKNVTFKNAISSQSYGAEVDVRKSLEFFKFNNKYISWLNDLTLVLNASLIKSEVKVDDPLARSSKRNMQGQSPYIVNTGLFYQNDSLKYSFSILYNIIGPRIVFVGTVDNPHTYEMPRNLIDLSISKKIGNKLNLKLNIKDILNQPIIFQQFEEVYLSSSPTTKSERIQETKNTIQGRQISIGVSYDF